MRHAAYIFAIIIFLCVSCRNAVGGKEKMAYEKADSSHLKNNPHDIDSLLLADNTQLLSFYKGHGYQTVWTNAAIVKPFCLPLKA